MKTVLLGGMVGDTDSSVVGVVVGVCTVFRVINGSTETVAVVILFKLVPYISD